MKDWKEEKLEYRRSKQVTPFCPFCKEELDELDLINYSDSCKCGKWSQNYEGKSMYKPKEL